MIWYLRASFVVWCYVNSVDFLFLGCVLILNVDCLVKCFGKFVWCGGWLCWVCCCAWIDYLFVFVFVAVLGWLRFIVGGICAY